MNPDLKKKVIADLEKSGFGSEMRALKLFLSHRWGCLSGSSFIDLDEQKPREYDLLAFQLLNNKADAQQLDCWFHIIAHVKKTEKPWVVFKTHLGERVTLYDAGDELFTYKN